VPGDIDASMEARLLFVVFSDYYHEKGEKNDYLESRSINTDFGKNLFGKDYSEEEWNADYNFMLQCCRFYLSLVGENVKLQPPMGDIKMRQYKADMGTTFEDWAGAYFSPQGCHLNCFIPRKEAIESFQAETKNYKWSTQRFTKALTGFAKFNADWLELNPADLRGSDGRIIKKDGSGMSVEMIYLRTIGQHAVTEEREEPEKNQNEIDWDNM
jgi:hypothetical protein